MIQKINDCRVIAIPVADLAEYRWAMDIALTEMERREMLSETAEDRRKSAMFVRRLSELRNAVHEDYP